MTEDPALRARKFATDLDRSRWSYASDALGHLLLLEDLKRHDTDTLLPFSAARVFHVQTMQHEGRPVQIATPLPLLSNPSTPVLLGPLGTLVAFDRLSEYDAKQLCLLVGQAIVQNELVQDALRAQDSGLILPGSKGFVGAQPSPRR